jgi:hypothetical protein
MNSPSTSARLAAAFAAVVITVLLTASQFGLAEHYSGDPARYLAARQAPHMAQTVGAADKRSPRT